MNSASSETTDYAGGYEAGSYPQAAANAVQNWTECCKDEVTRAVEENPAGTLMTAFGIGLGLGAMVGLSIALSAPRPTARSRAEDLGQRLLDSLHDYIPDSVSRRFG